MSGGDWKAMFKGIQDNDIELVKFYIRSGIDPNYQHPEFMALPLSESIRFNYLKITEFLVQNGANPNIIEMETGLSPKELCKKLNNERALIILNALVKE